MLYKKITFPILSLTGLLLAGGCPKGQQASTTVSDNKGKPANNKTEGSKTVLSLSSCKALDRSISCMGGQKSDFLLQIEGNIPSISSQSQGQVAFIWLPAGAASPTKESPIVKEAMGTKTQIEELIQTKEGHFIYWNNIDKARRDTKKWIIKVGEGAYKIFTSKQYALYMLYAPSGASPENCLVSTTPFQMDIKDKDPSLPNWEGIGLAAIDPINSSTGWLLKGKVDRSFLPDAKVGFILIKEEEAVNLYDLVQKVIASENEWPAQPTPFSSAMMIVPASVRDIDPPIAVTLPSSEAPIQSGNFKLFCYLIKHDKHCYLSQMGHILSDGSANALSQESAPESITFTGSSRGLKVLDLKLSREQVSGDVPTVKLSDFTFEYSLNDQVEALPSDLQLSLLFVEKGTIWRTSILESLFKESYESNSNAIATDDGTICLVRDSSKLDPSSIDFFSRAADYEYFACLFSTDDHKLKFYTEKETLRIEESETSQPQPQKPEVKEGPPKITLDNVGANITLHTPWIGKNHATFTAPQVNLEPSRFDKGELKHRGFLMAKAGELDSENMPAHNSMVQNFINDSGNKSVSSKGTFVIFKEDNQDNLLKEELYKVYQKEKKGDSTLVISYWAQYKDQIIWSSPVSIQLIRK